MDVNSFTSHGRVDVGEGIAGWVYSYWNPIAKRYDGLSDGLEFAVQVKGSWIQESVSNRGRNTSVGEAYHMNLGEQFTSEFGGRDAGVQVGFAVYPWKMSEFKHLSGELCFDNIAPQAGRHMRDLCESLALGAVPEQQVRTEVIRYIQTRCVERRRDPIMVGKGLLEQHFASNVGIETFADQANVHPATFARHFKRRYGLSPVTYRHRWRLHQAGGLLRLPDVATVRDIAERCGIPDESYFYREFFKNFGCAPTVYRQRVVAMSSKMDGSTAITA